MMTSLVELQQLYLPDLAKSAELIGQERSRRSKFHTPKERHGASLAISLTS